MLCKHPAALAPILLVCLVEEAASRGQQGPRVHLFSPVRPTSPPLERRWVYERAAVYKSKLSRQSSSISSALVVSPMETVLRDNHGYSYRSAVKGGRNWRDGCASQILDALTSGLWTDPFAALVGEKIAFLHVEPVPRLRCVGLFELSSCLSVFSYYETIYSPTAVLHEIHPLILLPAKASFQCLTH